jgi:lipopolysaccharide export system protein LptA
MERAGAEHVSADRVVMTNSGARTIDAKSAQIDRSGVLAVQSDKAVFYNSTAVAVAAEEVRLVRGMVLAMKADQVTIEGEARVAIYAGPASASVKPLVDAGGALAFGAAFGAALALVGAMLRRVFR